MDRKSVWHPPKDMRVYYGSITDEGIGDAVDDATECLGAIGYVLKGLEDILHFGGFAYKGMCWHIRSLDRPRSFGEPP